MERNGSEGEAGEGNPEYGGLVSLWAVRTIDSAYTSSGSFPDTAALVHSKSLFAHRRCPPSTGPRSILETASVCEQQRPAEKLVGIGSRLRNELVYPSAAVGSDIDVARVMRPDRPEGSSGQKPQTDENQLRSRSPAAHRQEGRLKRSCSQPAFLDAALIR